jgi:hypothetical protein
MAIQIKNEFIDFKVYPASSVFVDFKKEMGKSIEVALSEEGAEHVPLIGKILFLGHKAYARLTNSKVLVTEEQILDSLTISELGEYVNKFIGTEVGGQKKTK